MKVIVTNVDKDVDKVGTYEKHRVVIYVDAGALKLLYCFLDGWVKWRLVNPIE